MTKRALTFAALLFLVLGFVGLLGLGLMDRSPVTGRSGATRVGKPAPDFVLPLFSGGEFKLSAYRGQPLVINFWASWCPPCVEEAPALERVWQSYRDQGIVVLGVNMQDAEGDARAFLAQFNITYPNGPDTTGSVTVDYGVIGLPVTFFVDRQGVVQRRWVGAISESQLTTWAEALLSGAPASGPTEGENPQEFYKFN